MRIVSIIINEQNVQVTIDPLRCYNTNKVLVESSNEFLCYFKIPELDSPFYGELFRDENRIPLIFNTPDAAIQYAKIELYKRLLY